MSRINNTSYRRPRTIAMLAATALVIAGASLTKASASSADPCDLGDGPLSITDLPAGASATECLAVGKVVRHQGSGLTVPPPGMAVGGEILLVDGSVKIFQMAVSTDGKIAYDFDSVDEDSSSGTDAPDEGLGVVVTAPDLIQESDDHEQDSPDISPPDAVPVEDVDTIDAAALSACSDGLYATNDVKEYGTYNWYIGDGGMPAALSGSAAQAAFADAINNITGSYNNCGYGDEVSASASYRGTTTYEADIASDNTCTNRDQRSTWDAGNLVSSTVARSCWWTLDLNGMKDDLIESDVRFNTTDHNFTNNPTSSCVGKYDLRSVGAHEAGHVFGMGHVSGGTHVNLTMYTNMFFCKTKFRTLGKGDVLGLRSMY